jgi:hypothetical protein
MMTGGGGLGGKEVKQKNQVTWIGARTCAESGHKGFLIREQRLDDLGKEADNANQGHGAPEIRTGGAQMVGGPNNVDRAEEVAPFEMAC